MSNEQVIIGVTETGAPVKLDLERLIETRLLIQSNSGGGKSYAIRKILEEASGHVQIIVLDLEGEFGTLREKYDFLLVGEGGEAPISIRTADLLAKKLLELQVSTIINLYELKHYERITFVKRFLDSMINAPKELWHPCLVIVDEAHIFCGEGVKSESASSVIDLCTRGRKRGYTAVLATQRLSKLHKDAAAEMLNVMIGRTSLDIDSKRAADILGFTTKEQMLSLRSLEPGFFNCFGPALTQAVTKVKIGLVRTTHPKLGARLSMQITPPTAKIKAVISKLVDLPKEAEQEARTIADFQLKVRELQQKLRQQANNFVSTAPPVDNTKLIDRARAEGFKSAESQLSQRIKALEAEISSFNKRFNKIREVMEMPQLPQMKPVFPPASTPQKKPLFAFKPVVSNVYAPTPAPQPIEQGWSGSDDDRPLKKCEQAIINAVNFSGGRDVSRKRVTVHSGYADSGNFSNAIGSLRSRGLITRNGDLMSLTAEGMLKVNQDMPSDLKAYWLSHLKKAPRLILQTLLDAYPNAISKDDLCAATGYSDSGNFSNAIGRLNTLGLINKDNGTIRVSDELVEGQQ